MEEILAAKGENVKKSYNEEGTLEVTLEDIVGSQNMKKLTDGDIETS